MRVSRGARSAVSGLNNRYIGMLRSGVYGLCFRALGSGLCRTSSV